jgi:hypothetical protein
LAAVAGRTEAISAVAGEHGALREHLSSAALAENTEKTSVAVGEHGDPAEEGIASSDMEC